MFCDVVAYTPYVVTVVVVYRASLAACEGTMPKVPHVAKFSVLSAECHKKVRVRDRV